MARTTYAEKHDAEKQTGLLTRFVPRGLKSSAIYSWWLRFTRFLQAVSSIISLGTFSSRIYKVYRLVNSIKTEQGINRASQAVEGILAAAVLYTIIATLFMCITKQSSGGPTWLRWLWVLLDLLFVGAFIAAAILTSPDGGQAGPSHCYSTPQAALRGNADQNLDDESCHLPYATFILAIISTILHAITASFHEIKDHRNKHHNQKNLHHHDDNDMEQISGTRV